MSVFISVNYLDDDDADKVETTIILPPKTGFN